jgi:uncharacterized coiled-coil DUF342 family protein
MDENQLNELKQKVQDVLTDGQIKLSEISVISENAKSKETELNTFHTRIIELKLQAENKAGALTETYNNAVTIKQQIDELHNQATQQKNNIDALHTDSSTKTNGINEFFGKFQELRQQVENPEEGIASTLNKAVEIFGQISKTNTDATVSKDEILKHKIKSEGLLEESSQLKVNINTKFLESEKLKEEIGQILDLVRDTGLANSFDRRRKRSQWSSLIALGVILLGVGISAYLIYKVFLSTEGQALFDSISNDYIKFLLRLTLTAPGVFTAWFGAAQYGKERHFLEQYEFKTAAALALENYTKLLKDNYPDQVTDIFNLNLELIRSVYKEPDYSRGKGGFSAKVKIPKADKEVGSN